MWAWGSISIMESWKCSLKNMSVWEQVQLCEATWQQKADSRKENWKGSPTLKQMKKRHILQFLQTYECFLTVLFIPSSGRRVQLVQNAKQMSDLTKLLIGDQEEINLKGLSAMWHFGISNVTYAATRLVKVTSGWWNHLNIVPWHRDGNELLL